METNEHLEPSEEDAIAGVVGAAMFAVATDILLEQAKDQRARWPHIIANAMIGIMTIGDRHRASRGETPLLQTLRETLDAGPDVNWARFGRERWERHFKQ